MAIGNAERQRNFRRRIKESGGKRLICTITQEQLEAIEGLLNFDLHDSRKSKAQFFITGVFDRAVAAKRKFDRFKRSGVSNDLLEAYRDAELKALWNPIDVEEYVKLFEYLKDKQDELKAA
jgi:hypothetical protein